MAAGPAQPGNSHALPGRHAAHPRADGRYPAHDLVARNHRQHGVGQLAIDEVKVGPAHAAGFDPQQDLAGGRARHGQLDRLQGQAGAFEQHGAHGGRAFVVA